MSAAADGTPTGQHGDDRPRVKIDGLLLAHQQPQCSIDTGAKTKKHEIIGRPDVVQHLGEKARRVSMRGHCYRDEGHELIEMRKKSTIHIRHVDFVGDVVLEDISVEPEGAYGGKRHGWWRYMYRLEAVEAIPPERR